MIKDLLYKLIYKRSRAASPQTIEDVRRFIELSLEAAEEPELSESMAEGSMPDQAAGRVEEPLYAPEMSIDEDRFSRDTGSLYELYELAAEESADEDLEYSYRAGSGGDEEDLLLRESPRMLSESRPLEAPARKSAREFSGSREAVRRPASAKRSAPAKDTAPVSDALKIPEKFAPELEMTFQQMLLRMIDSKGWKDSQVYRKANLDRRLFSKIRSNENYKPSKSTALSLAIALELNLDETTDLLQRAGLALSPSIMSDLIVKYCIINGIYDIYDVNSILYEYDQQLLGV